MAKQNIDTVRRLVERHSNWGRWGPDDELGTLNHIDPSLVQRAAASVTNGRVISLALPYDENGPQTGGLGRFNPIHLMLRDGANAIMGTTVRDFFGGRDQYLNAADDLIIMPLQCGTQWDALAHIIYEGKIYNGYSASEVSNKGARRNDIAKGRDRLVGRGVLLDLPRYLGVDWLDPGYAIGSDELDGCARACGVEVRRGDCVLVRTGQLAQVRHRGEWADYAGGAAPGLGLAAADWIAEREIAALATDTWGMEVRPNETEDVYQPLHIVFIVHLGLWVGEMFDLEELAKACAEEARHEFLFVAPPLPFTKAVASPVNPIAIL